MLIKKFEEQVKKNPDKIAIKTGRLSFTYDRLNREANRMARLLTERCSPDRKDEAVGLFFEHGPHMIAAILGTLKAGKIYVPLSTDYPENRLSYMLSNSESSLLLTNSEHQERAKILSGKTGIDLLVIDQEVEAVCEQDPERDIFTGKLAYIMYTSGSTGRPKGVKQTHKNILYYTGNWTRIFSITAADNMTLFSSFCHDGSVQDLFGALLKGATLFPLNIRDREEAFELGDFLIREKITIWHSVPSLYSYFVNTLTGMDPFKNLRFLLLGGEAVREHEVVMYKKYFPHSVLANVYGQTESSVDSIRLIRREDSFDEPLIGEPLDETKIFIIDEEGDEVDTLQTGEIVIASPYISPGYWKNEAASQKTFSEDEEWGRLYWTGDHGRLLPGGGIVFMGRKDHQVKIRGFRIELAEIETRLLVHENIKEAVVMLKGDGREDKVLTAYYVADAEIPPASLREFSARELPDYMVPTFYVRLPNFPLTQSGKIDRQALPDPEINPDGEYTAPRDKIEQELVGIWSGVLGVEEEKIGISTNFFALGGHSLRATVLISMVHKQMDVRVPLAELFRRPTIKDMAKFISETEKEQHVSINKVGEKPYYSLSSAQKRLFIIEQMGNLNTTYNMPGAVKIEGPLHEDSLDNTFRALLERHESFRTTFTWIKGEPVQRVYDAREIEFKIEHYEIGNREEQEAGILESFVRPFELAQAPLLRVGLIKIEKEEHILFFDMHHIICDGISVDILVHEFVGLYTGEKLQPLRLQYKDFSEWENRFFDSRFIKKQENFWLEYLKGELPELHMPLDFNRPKKQTFTGKEVFFTIPVEITEKLNILAGKKNITLNILILSIYFLLLAKYGNGEDIIVGSLVSGRNHADLKNIIGMFGNFLPLRNYIEPGSTFSEYLDFSGRQILTAYDNQDYPFEKIIDLLGFDIDFSRNPVFDTMLIFHNEVDRSIKLEIENLKFSSYPLKKQAATLDFKLDIYMGTQGELPCILEFNTGLFKEKTMRRFIEHFIELIDKVIKEPEKRIAEIEIFNEEEKLELAEKRELYAPGAKKKIRVAVSATFTSEPVENFILWWGEQFGLPIDLEFAPYNQVFPQLLDEKSLLSINRGINLLLIRFEDWIRDLQLPAEDICDKLEDDFNRLVKIMKEKPKPVPYFAGIFPTASHLSLKPQVRYYIEGLYRRWKKIVTELDNVYPVDFLPLKELYAIGETFDPIADKEGHVPFSGEFYAAMGTAVVRKIYALDHNPFKVVALDCDNTLWRGICGEDGAENVQVAAPYAELQRLMIRLYDEGFLLTLCSKNNESDAWEVFEKNRGMLLRKEHFAGWRINWQPKSANLKALAEELNLGIDSFIFIDDSPVECAETRANCPEVLTLQLPENPASIPLFLKHIWGFDKIKVTAEDRSRTQMYRAEKKRKEAEKDSLTLSNFLGGLQLKISMNFPTPDQAPRISQLTQRTNQFNLSTIRRREDEIARLSEEPGMRVWVIEVSDRFGDYGLVGVVITKEEKESLFIDTFLLSCRVLGREVETAILAGLRRYCAEKQLKSLIARYYPTEKNKPFLKFLQERWHLSEKHGEEYTLFVYPLAETSEAIEFAGIYYLEQFEKKRLPEKPAGEKFAAVEAGVEPATAGGKTVSSPRSQVGWNIDIAAAGNLLHKNHLLPLQYSTAGLLTGLPAYNSHKETRSRAKYEAAGNEVESKLVEIWEKILRIEGIGVNDSFFDSGGNSLKVITLLSEIHKTFNAELTFRDIFDNKTIRQISGLTAGARENLYSAIEAAQEKAYYSMSSAQKRLFILQQLEPASTAYNLTAVLALSGNTDKKRLLDTAKKLIAHQESLRTSFEILAEEPVQRIHNPGDIEFEIEYYEAKNKQEEKDTIARFIRPFDLTQAPLLRIGLIKIETRTHILTISMHHIISDGASSEIFSREFAALYAGKELPPLKIRYKDYSEWLNSPATKEATAKQKQYWLEQFTGEIPVLDLPTDFPRPVKQSFAGHTIKFGIGKEETIRLLDLSKELESTIFMVLSASFNVLLTKLSGREDIVLGSPVLGRMHAGLEGIIGMFVNTLALRNYPGGELTVREFLNRVKQRSIEAFENQDYPFEELVDNLAVRRDLSRNPLFDVMFRLFTYSPSSPAAAERDGEGLRPGNYEYEDRAAIVDLQLTALESADKISFSVEYCTELFKAETIKRFIGYFKKIILSLPHLLDKKIREIEIISAEEKKTILFDFNREQTAYPRSKTIHRLFEEQVQKTPAAIALTMHRPETAGVAVTLTYMELNREADYLARILVEKGIKTGNIAALMVERSIEMMVGIFAVLKAGGAYLPIDPRYPQNRQEYIVKDSNATLLLTARSLEKEVEALRNLQIERIFIDETVRSDLIHQKQSAAALASRSGDPAYVIYTSGSTGLPKGVMIEHHSVNNRLYWMQKGYPLSSDDIILQKTTYTFDVSVWELFWWSFFGAGLCLLTPGGEKDPAAIIDAVVKHRVSTMHFVPSMLDAFLHYIEMQEAPLPPLTLRQVFASGEALKPDQVEKFNRLLHRVHGTNLINLYGPTEATVDVSYFNCYGVEKLDRIPIGKPIDNIRLYILDRALGFQPIGVAGQLYIAGAGLARGYLNRPELTAEKFIASKQEGRTQQLTNSRLIYQTGDLARWLKDGNIEYLGRIDNQVKIRGFRIELGEIENRLAEHARVRQAVVLDKPAPDGDRYLVAYVAAERDIENDLRDFLTQTLPDYMVPGRFVFLPQIPLTSNGKVNRKALPEPEALTGELDYTAPRDAVEEKLVKIWSAVLGLDSENIGIDHNFFHLGGHSLKATILTASIQKALSVKVPLEQIFKTPAIRGLAEFIKSASYDRFYSINDAEKKEYYALSSSQKRLYILQRIDHGSTAYNIPNVMTLTGEVDLQRLRGTFRKLIRRHESLRTSFLMAGGEPVQRVCGAADIEFDIEYYDVESKDQGRAGDFIRSFDLANAPLLRVVLKKIAAAKHVLIVDMHHIISDGVSGRIIAEEFMNLYRGEDLAPIRVQYKDFSEWRNSKGQQEAVKEQGAYWLEQFAGEVPVLNLPGDFSRPPVQSFAGSTVKFELGAEETAVLNRIALDREVTLFMVLLAVFNILLSRLSGQEDIIVGTPTAGRRHADVAGIIGIFINTLGLRNFPMGGKTFVDFLHEVKYTTLKAFENQEYQFEDLVEKVEVKRDVSRNPLFDVLLVLQNMENPEIEIPSGLKLASYEHETGIAKFDLSLYGAEFGEKLGFVVEYCTKLFKKETIIKFVNYFKNLISEVTGDPGKKINEFRLVPEEEMQQVLFGFNDTGVPYEADKTLVRLFEEQAERTPDRVVVVGPDYPETGQDGNTSPIRSLQLTYRLLAEKARCIGDCLREKGVAPDIITGLLVERSLNMITGLLGILKAGGAYLPIDPEYPPERIDYMLRESRAPLLLTTRRSIGDVEKTASSNIETVFIGEIGNREQRLGIGKKQKKEQASGDLAYVIYTSGSTGKPKGVALCHRNVVNFIKGMTGVIDFSPGKTILAITTICFDIFVLEILLPLVSGLKFVIADEVEQKVPGRLARLIVNNGIDMLQFTPSRLNLLLSVDEELKCLSGVGDLMVGGEAFPERLFLHLKEKYTGNIHNMYGPTETAVWSAVKNLTAAEKINIGKPIANTRIFILDKAGAPQPAGIPGELCIGGDGLARGYINRPELTAEKFRTAFIAHHSMQLYTTGDLCRLLPDGEIEFLGRMDYQVKIRGFRIELGEIESALKSYGGQKIIKDAVVIDRDGGDGVKRLSAYIVSLKEVTVSELRSYLSGKLPDYMIPSYFVQIESLPLTPNGKIDKKALAKHGKKLAGGTAYQEPRNAVEEKIAAVWQEFLHLDRVGIHDNYFELGGTSLDIIKVNVKLQETFQKEIPVVAMFRFTTVHSLAGYLSDEKITVRDRGNEVKKGKQNIQALRKRIGVKNG